MIVEGAIIFVLLLIIIKIPSHKKQAAVTTASLSYEHGSLSIPLSDKNRKDDGAGTTKVDPSRSKGGMSSYEDGNYETPAATEAPKDTPADTPADTPVDTPAGNDPGTTEPTTDTPTPTADPGDISEPTQAAPAGTGQTAVVKELGVLLRVEPNSTDDANGMYFVGQGQELPVLSTEVETSDPNVKNWVKVSYLGSDLYVEASYVEIK